MVDALCNLENIAKHCLKQIGTERSYNYGCRSLNAQVCLSETCHFALRAVLSKFCWTKWRKNL